jgi:hypothetical protein
MQCDSSLRWVCHTQCVQALRELDHAARFTSVRIICERIEMNMNFLNMWLFTDEAKFHVSGRVNTHNAIIRTLKTPMSHPNLKRQIPWLMCSEESLAARRMVPLPLLTRQCAGDRTTCGMLQLFVVPRLHHGHHPARWSFSALVNGSP